MTTHSEQSCDSIIESAVSKLGNGPLTEEALVEHIHPLFSRVLERNNATNEIYLANHSLGRPLDLVAHEVQRALDAWYQHLDGAWDLWIQQRDTYRKLIADLISISPWQSVVPKTSAGQGLRAVINSLPTTSPKIISTRGEFDSIDFILKAYHHKSRASVHWVESDQAGLYSARSIIDAMDDQTDLVVLSLVCFVSGQHIKDVQAIIKHAHQHGALVLIDAYHAFGTLPLNMHELNADFLIAGNYKYTRGGAGACFLAIHPKHLQDGGIPDPSSIFPIDTGWFAKLDTFAYRRTSEPEYEAGGDAWLESTPPTLVYFQSTPGLILTKAIGVDRLRAYSIQQQNYMIEQLKAQDLSPKLIEQRGAFFILETSLDSDAVDQLKAVGVNVDARPCPQSKQLQVRFCPDILNTKAELDQAVHRIAQAFQKESTIES